VAGCMRGSLRLSCRSGAPARSVRRGQGTLMVRRARSLAEAARGMRQAARPSEIREGSAGRVFSRVKPAASREEAGWEGRHRRPAGSDAPRARRSWSLAPRLRRAQPLPVDGRLKCVRTDPGFSPGRARPPPGCRAARLVAPETGRRRTLRHRLARTGSAPHQPRPASRPKPPPRASRTRLPRACPITVSDAAPRHDAS